NKNVIYMSCLILLCLLLIAPQDDKSIHLSEDLVIGSDQLIGAYISDVSAGEQGEIIVAIPNRAEVKVFSKDGDFLHAFGQRGRGPGDFRYLQNASMRFGLIYALDGGPNAKINIFDPADHETIQTIGFPRLETESALMSVVNFLFIDDEQVLATYRPMTSNGNIEDELRSSFYVVNTTIRDDKKKIFTSPARDRYVTRTEGGFINSRMPFARNNHVAILNNELFHMWTGDEKIQVYDLENFDNTGFITVDEVADQIPLEEHDYVRYYRDQLGIDPQEDIDNLAARAANDKGLQMSLRSIASMNENRDQLHDTFPVYNQLLSDGDHLWLTAPHTNRELQHLLQLDAEGQVLASGTLPARMEVKDIKDRYLYGLSEDEEGFTTVIRYALDIR
ncbi:MAG: 6-bladed beta-propeller, partial [Cyclonatronaceae bacterium]